MNPEASQYYRITDKSYKALVEGGTPFMNLGIWPASSILQAQNNLMVTTLNFADDSLTPHDRSHLQILELGPGWGGSRPLIEGKWPGSPYVGINCSAEQNTYAEQLNRDIPSTKYHCAFFESIERGHVATANTAIGVESVLHVQNKAELFKRLFHLGIHKIILAEICAEDLGAICSNPLFDPSLKYTRSVSEYEKAFAEAGFPYIRKQDLTAQVFEGWSKALDEIELETYQGNSRVLRQFKSSYGALATLAEQAKIKYVLYFASVS